MNHAPVFFKAFSLIAILVCASSTLHAQQSTVPASAVGVSFRINGDTTTTAPVTAVVNKSDNGRTATGVVSVSPNPAKDRFQIRLNIEKENDMKLAIFDEAGVLVTSLLEGSMPVGLHMMEYSTRDLANGTYVVRLESEGTSATAKVIVRH